MRAAVEIARELARIGAEAVVRAAPDAVLDPRDGLPCEEAALDGIAERMRRATDAPDRPALEPAGFWLAMLCAAAELHPDAAAALSILSGDRGTWLPTPSTAAWLVSAALAIPYDRALDAAQPWAAARALGWVEPAGPIDGRPASMVPLRLGRRILRKVLGEVTQAPDAALVVAPRRGTGLRRAWVEGAGVLLQQRGLLVARCASPRSGRQLAIDLASLRGTPAVILPAGDTMPDPSLLAGLEGLAVIDLTQLPEGVRPTGIDAMARALGALVVLVGGKTDTGGLPTLDVPPLTAADARRVWELVIDPELAGPLAARFRLDVVEAAAAVGAARDHDVVEGGAGLATEASITAQVLAEGARRMGRVVRCIETRATLDDLVVPPPLRSELEHVVAWYAATERVYEGWGMGRASTMGRGLTCLFSGPPGTGKTFAAHCIANALGLNLYQVDLSQVVSKYIGETERALAQVFDEAEAGHGLILFDEADTLFGKRSEVRDARDRYANIEVGYLLQRMEQFSGVSILTTNLDENIDGAFLRRIRFQLEFPAPGEEERRLLWERSLPTPDLRAPGIDIALLAQRFRFTGGHIHNIGLSAAHMAVADNARRVGPEHVVRATYRELTKAGMARSRDAFGAMARWLEAG